MTEFLFFTQPMALFLIALLPLLWLIFRLFPLRPRQVVFPALVLFDKDKKDRPKPRDIPLWLKLLRLSIILFFILALARPIFDPGRQALSFDPTLIVIDNSWASASGWDERVEAVKSRLSAFAAISRVPLAVVATAVDSETGRIPFESNLTPEEAIRFVATLAPRPWNSDYGKVVESLKTFLYQSNMPWQSFWFGDGQSGKSQKQLYDLISDYGPVIFYHDPVMNEALAISEITPAENGIETIFKRRYAGKENAFDVTVISEEGDTLLRQNIVFPKDGFEIKRQLSMPPEILNQVARIQISAPQTAAGTWYISGGWAPVHIGVMTEHDIRRKQDYLSDVFYITRALKGQGKLSTGAASALTADETISLIILPDSTRPSDEDYTRLTEWVKKGGTLLRFAGSNLVSETAPQLLPVQIYGGERNLGGAMSWQKPAKIGSFDKDSPFLSLEIPRDVFIRQQVLARPSINLNEKRWIALEDQTPLVTADRIGSGSVILFHTTADPSWSDIVLSDIFPALMKAVSDFAGDRGLSVTDDVMLAPSRMVNAYGRLVDPSPLARVMSYGDIKSMPPSPESPAGLYHVAGTESNHSFIARNLGSAIAETLKPAEEFYYFDKIISYDVRPYLDLSTLFYILALLLFAVESLVTHILLCGGGLVRGVSPIAAIMGMLICLMPHTALAQQADVPAVLQGDKNKINFAYIETGNVARDRISRKGLEALGQALRQRTTVEFNAVAGVDPQRDDLTVYPFLYWPMVASQEQPSQEAIAALQYYLDHGGMIFFDTRDGQYESTGSTLGQETLQRLTRGLTLGALEKLDDDHVLTRSYYLLNSYEGQYRGRPVWVEAVRSTDYDGAPSIVIGAHDWAQAWASIDMNQDIISRQTSSRSKELALRFGVNLAMMALTGNYKTDQVHVKYILERIENND